MYFFVVSEKMPPLNKYPFQHKNEVIKRLYVKVKQLTSEFGTQSLVWSDWSYPSWLEEVYIIFGQHNNMLNSSSQQAFGLGRFLRFHSNFAWLQPFFFGCTRLKPSEDMIWLGSFHQLGRWMWRCWNFKQFFCLWKQWSALTVCDSCRHFLFSCHVRNRKKRVELQVYYFQGTQIVETDHFYRIFTPCTISAR